MKTKEKLKYIYNPQRLSLAVLRDGKIIGWFVGSKAEEQFAIMLDRDDVELSITTGMNDKSGKVRRLRAIWNKSGVDHDREYILAPYGVDSTADLNEQQLDELISHYSAMLASSTKEELRKLRSDNLVLLNKIGIFVVNNDWTNVNSYLLDPRIGGKMLFEMSIDELKALRVKLNSIADKMHTIRLKENTLSKLN